MIYRLMAILLWSHSLQVYGAMEQDHRYGAGIGLGRQSQCYAFGVEKFLTEGIGIAEGLNLRIGLASRLLHIQAQNRTFQTAGSTERSNGPIDSMKVKKTKHSALNFGVVIESQPISNQMLVGVNLDVLGKSLGHDQMFADYQLDSGGWNLFRFGYNDLGTLHSEAYIGLPYNHYYLKFGLSHTSTQYRIVSGSGDLQSKRFLNFSDALFVALVF